MLSPALFQSRVIPVLLQLFEVHEEHVRMVLLSHIEAYVEHFTQEQLKKVILPQVRTKLAVGVSNLVKQAEERLSRGAVLPSREGKERFPDNNS